MQSAVLTDPNTQLTVCMVEGLLEQCVKVTINSEIPLLSKPGLYCHISHSLDPGPWQAPDVEQVNQWRLYCCIITMLSICLTITD